MLKFIRTVDKSLEDFFILDLKTLGNLIDNVDDHSPDAFRYGKFNRVSCHFAKESAYSLIGRESSCRGSMLYCMEVIAVHAICEAKLRT